MAQHEFKDTKNGLRENANKKIIAKNTTKRQSERTSERTTFSLLVRSFVQNWQPKERTLQKTFYSSELKWHMWICANYCNGTLRGTTSVPCLQLRCGVHGRARFKQNTIITRTTPSPSPPSVSHYTFYAITNVSTIFWLQQQLGMEKE